MFFWNKPSVITVDCFTYLESVILNYPIASASKFYPESIKSVPAAINAKVTNNPNSNLTTDVETVRHCHGLNALYSSGIVLPAWDTFDVEMYGDNSFLINPPGSIKGDYHPRWQYGNSLYGDSSHIKLISPWFIKEKTGVKFIWMHPTWNRSDTATDISILPAIVDYKKQNVTHINAFIKNGSIVSFKAGEPLVHMIPMSEKKIKINIHLVSHEEYKKNEETYYSHMRLKNHRNLIYPNLFKRKKKCPFGF